MREWEGGKIRNRILLAIVIAVVLITAAFSILFTFQVATKVVASAWTVGDYWEYDENSTMEGLHLRGKEKKLIKEKDVINISGTNHSVFIVSASGNGSFNGSFQGASLNGSWTSEGWEYYDESSLTLVKLIYYIYFLGEWRYLNGAGSLIMSMENQTTFENVKSDWSYSFVECGQGTVNSTAKTNFGIQMDLGWPYPDYVDSHYLSYNEKVTYTCLKTERVILPVGDFDTYLVREKRGDGSFQLHWYSPEVGGSVKVEFYDMDGVRNGDAELVSYSHKGAMDASSVSGDLTFLLLVILISAGIAISILAIFLRFRALKKEDEMRKRRRLIRSRYTPYQYEGYPNEHPPPDQFRE